MRLSCVLLTAGLIGGVFHSAKANPSPDEIAVSSTCILYPNPDFAPRCLISVPFMAPRQQFTFHRADSSQETAYAFLQATFRLFNEEGMAIDSAGLPLTVRAASVDEAQQSGQVVSGEISLLANPGRYTARLQVVDRASGKMGEWFYPLLLIPSPVSSRPVLGGAALGHSIRYRGDDSSAMPMTRIRNGYDLTVNPLSLYASSDSLFAVYAECYNLTPDNGDSVRYAVMIDVLATDGSVALPFGASVRRGASRAIVVAKQLSFQDLPAGNYLLRMILVDSIALKGDSVLLPFRRQVPFVAHDQVERITAASADTGAFAALSTQERLDCSYHWLEPQQRPIVEALGDSGRQNYLNQFWSDQERQTGKAPGSLRNMVAERYLRSLELFSDGMSVKNGWKTDRGRIYILYGPWELKDERAVPSATSPYEIWYYKSVREGLIFVFEDTRATQDYRLVHSNSRGERFDSNWDALIKEYFR